MILASAILLHAALLDGTKLKVKVVPNKAAADKGAKAFDDDLIFADGKFTSTALLQKGFKPGKYNAETEPHEAEFEAQMFNGTKNSADWSGEIRGTNTMGSLQLQQKDGTYLSYEFTGTKE
jgi:hypothetical protein